MLSTWYFNLKTTTKVICNYLSSEKINCFHLIFRISCAKMFSLDDFTSSILNFFSVIWGKIICYWHFLVKVAIFFGFICEGCLHWFKFSWDTSDNFGWRILWLANFYFFLWWAVYTSKICWEESGFFSVSPDTLCICAYPNPHPGCFDIFPIIGQSGSAPFTLSFHMAEIRYIDWPLYCKVVNSPTEFMRNIKIVQYASQNEKKCNSYFKIILSISI